MKDILITKRFLLENRSAERLYHTYAEKLPIIDYHCHLSPAELAGNRRFGNMTEAWLAGDHYKWRAMRACGVPEKYITGDATPWEKFEMWARTVPKTIRNPLYHWTHLELKKPFGISNKLLNEKTARSVWNTCNTLLKKPDFTTQGILKRMKVEVVCTTDDPVDSLEHHRAFLKQKGRTLKMLPAFRADKAMAIDQPAVFLKWIGMLEAAVGFEIRTYDALLQAIRQRHQYFHENGCRLSDHGLETVYAEEYRESEVGSAFKRALRGKSLSPDEILKFKSAVLYELAVLDHGKGWVQQFHLGALRNNNTRMLRTLGPDTGYDSIGDFEIIRPLSRLLNRLEEEDRLAKTILYNLNPRDNEALASMTGNFQDGTVAGKIQFGAAWWFLDQLDGMRRQMDALSSIGVLSQFVGMLTDSRSFLSYPRHEYFRRLLCNILGGEMERGLIPKDFALVGGIVQDICYKNARRYFRFLE